MSMNMERGIWDELYLGGEPDGLVMDVMNSERSRASVLGV